MKFRLDNPDCNEWIVKANALISKYEDWTPKNHPRAKLSLHHILIRSKFPQLKDDPNNVVWLPYRIHWLIHYYMWRANSDYCAAFWFCYVYFKKHYGMTIPGDEETRLIHDMSLYKKIE